MSVVMLVVGTGCDALRKKKPAECPPPVEQAQPAPGPAVTADQPGAPTEEELQQFVNQHIHFAFDKSDLDDDARTILRQKAVFLKKYAAVAVTIEGNCDERGSNEYNMALGDRRAFAAKEFLVGLGIEADRLATISYGEEKPLDPGHNEEAWAKNRRAQFVLK